MFKPRIILFFCLLAITRGHPHNIFKCQKNITEILITHMPYILMFNFGPFVSFSRSPYILYVSPHTFKKKNCRKKKNQGSFFISSHTQTCVFFFLTYLVCILNQKSMCVYTIEHNRISLYKCIFVLPCVSIYVCVRVHTKLCMSYVYRYTHIIYLQFKLGLNVSCILHT